MISPTDTNRLIIGWREWISLPELNIPAVKVKIDTGARTSSLHTFDLDAYREDGQPKVRFGIQPLQRKKKIVLWCTADIMDRRMVTDSGGHREMRYVIRTPIQIGDHSWPIEITLTKRDTMKFRMLLGRTAIRNRYVVDPDNSYRFGRSLSKSYITQPRQKEGT
jgi:hypothetical protein